MAAPNVRDVLRVPVQGVLNPTNLALPYPYGGTALGNVKDVVLMPTQRRRDILAGEFGAVVNALVHVTTWVVTVVFRGFDPDAWTAIFPNTGVGAVSGYPHVHRAGTVRSGYLASTRAVKLLIAPEDPEHAPAMYLPNALPYLDDSVKINFNLGDEMLLGVAFVPVLGTDGEDIHVTFLRDLVL